MAKVNLSIYLIKENIETIEDIIKEEYVTNSAENELLRRDPDKVAYFKKSFNKQPDWLLDFFNIDEPRLRTSNARVVYINKVEVSEGVSRFFAVIFGYGKSMLKDDVVEENFGLKIVLNTVDKNKIRRLSKVDIGKNYKQSQEQLPKEGDINDFGFDEYKDLVRYVTAKSDDDMFGKVNITGGDLFNLTIDKNIDNIDDFLLYCYGKYLLTTYLENFKWLDNIVEVRGSDLISALEDELVKRLNDGDFETIWMGIPDFINWDGVKGFRMSGQRNRGMSHNDIYISDFMDVFTEEISDFDKIKSKSVYAISNDDRKIRQYSWPAHKCLIGNFEYQEKTYSINNGKWYEINNDFVREINEKYNDIALSDIEVLDFEEGMMDETTYNNLLCETFPNYYMLHEIKVPIGGGRGNSIEPCDVIYNNNFIHIKRGGSSSYLSHLFNQGLVSATAFKDSNFRRKFNNKIVERELNNLVMETFDAKDYCVVIGIINKNPSNDRPHIPFFSKVSISEAKQAIENMGYDFKIKSIKSNRLHINRAVAR